MRVTAKLRFITLLLAFTWCATAHARLTPEEVPTFQLRGHVVSLQGQAPTGKSFTYRLSSGSGQATSTGTDWSDWIKFDRPQVETVLKGYPALYMEGYPVITHLNVGGVVDTTNVEAEVKLDENGATATLKGELFGPDLGLVIWRDADKTPHVATMAEYNQRYWKALDGSPYAKVKMPVNFPIADRFIGADTDRIAWREGLSHMANIGANTLYMPASKEYRSLLLDAGVRRTTGATYNPPGYAFDFDPKVASQAEIEKWAKAQAKPYLDAGFAPKDIALFAMSDEPGWYFPSAFKELTSQPAAMDRFHNYLQAQGLTPADVGAADWSKVQPLGRADAKDLPSKRLFYWTMRFYSWDMEQHFANCVRAMEGAFWPGMPIFTNMNFFNGRFYQPGPFGNNPDKKSENASMGGPDWMEFGRLRGGTALWTEDWFGDDLAYQWSYYSAKLRNGGRKSGVDFGGYVIPRTSGDRDSGLLQKILTLVGSGAKSLEYFVFGPEYNFPGNCYSEDPRLLPRLAEAHATIAAAEDVVWPGRRPLSKVAILAPRSAETWDAKNIAIPDIIEDCTNPNLNRRTVDYMAEVYNLYVALQHANIPAEFVDEDDLLDKKELAKFSVLYVTEPNLPVEYQTAVASWTKGGGTLVTVTGAAQADRYDEPSRVLADSTGFGEAPRERVLFEKLADLKEAGQSHSARGDFTAYGPRGALGPVNGQVQILAAFANDAPAIVERKVSRGRAIHFTFMPGLSYIKSQTGTKDRLPVGFSTALRDWITYPVQRAGIASPVQVDKPMIETPLLVSKSGAAVTALNWTGEPQGNLSFQVEAPFRVRSVTSVKRGALSFTQKRGKVSFAMPLDAADIIALRP